VVVLRASGLVKRFETTCAVDRVDLVVDEGEIRGLLGPNGAGKTTLLRMLFGLIAPDAGSVELLGRALEDPAAASLDGVAGFVEDPTFYPYLSGRANLELLAELDRSDARRRIEPALAKVGLAERADDRVSGYSSGMRQRRGVAAALLREPRLLLLDEPMAALDPVGLHEAGALLRELSAGGTAVVVSSHQIGEVEKICDSFTFMRRGAVVWDGSASQLREQAPASAYRLVTSDDHSALHIAEHHSGVSPRAHDDGLTITVREDALDSYVLALAKEGIAVRRLELLTSPLEAMFFALTEDDRATPRETARSEVAAAS